MQLRRVTERALLGDNRPVEVEGAERRPALADEIVEAIGASKADRRSADPLIPTTSYDSVTVTDVGANVAAVPTTMPPWPLVGLCA